MSLQLQQVSKVIWQKAASPFYRGVECIRHVRWTGTFARGGRQTMRNALMRRCVINGPALCPLLWRSAPHLIHGSSDPLESAAKRHVDRLAVFLHSTPVCQTQTSVAIGRIYAMRSGDAA